MLVPFRREHILGMNIKDSEAATMGRDDMAAALEWLETTGNGATLYAPNGKTVLGVLGAVPTVPGVCEVFVIPSKEQARYAKTFVLAVKDKLCSLRPKFRRIQAVSKPDEFHTRWLSWLGFQTEGVLRKYGPNGEDMIMWSLV